MPTDSRSLRSKDSSAEADARSAASSPSGSESEHEDADATTTPANTTHASLPGRLSHAVHHMPKQMTALEEFGLYAPAEPEEAARYPGRHPGSRAVESRRRSMKRRVFTESEVHLHFTRLGVTAHPSGPTAVTQAARSEVPVRGPRDLGVPCTCTGNRPRCRKRPGTIGMRGRSCRHRCRLQRGQADGEHSNSQNRCRQSDGHLARIIYGPPPQVRVDRTLRAPPANRNRAGQSWPEGRGRAVSRAAEPAASTIVATQTGP